SDVGIYEIPHIVALAGIDKIVKASRLATIPELINKSYLCQA
ncbi:MAG: hypothetical protein PWQ70_932, partial [Clostridiales bacterium]|nr:hypothetical protein [Clostridiales bacterium]